ncbi:hypothetical protein A2761_02495 [Candidatus Kaiserbacteria bacterium RIFCSPHIGHO2_01_FULL_51_33]|nr:MAG: hypothetical protein A2761_02495 [Candidatus Kaiserbacteria bacterium RIFCSPHIGHO2_01_FULL_51_33]
MIQFILNSPYTLVGLIVGIISLPKKVKAVESPRAIVLEVKSFWWTFGYFKNARAVTIGHCVLLSLTIRPRDLEHELIHVLQFARAPIIYPALYYVELIRKGYKNNKYEEEAHRIAGNVYKEK